MKDAVLKILDDLENADKVKATVFVGKENLIVSERSKENFKNEDEVVVLAMRAVAMMKSAIIEEPISINVLSGKEMAIIRSTKNGQLFALAEEGVNINLLDLEITRSAKK